jgi:archaellum component FlaG (FlaF/FlaG flagellin family)
MRYFAATFCLLCAVSAAMAQVVVVVRDVQPSSQNPRITVLSDGQAQPGAKLAVSDANGEKDLNVKLNVGAIAENVAIAGIRFEPTTAI